MYCSECGTPASGKFCANCGTRIAVPVTSALSDAPGEWSHEVRYDVLIAHPKVRDLLAEAARVSQRHISGEQILKVYDKFVVKAVCGVDSSDLATTIVPILTRMGIQTVHQRTESIAAPPGHSIVAVLSSLATRGNTIREVHQASNGCAIEAVLPSDLWSWEGTLLVTIEADGPRCRLDARTTIGGQMFDWGKGTRRLDQLVRDVHSFGARMTAA